VGEGVTYRNRKLLDAVRELPCCWPLPHQCVGLVEPAHSNQIRDGKGKGIKAHDYRVAAICHAAHAELDQGRDMTKDERREAWDEAHRRTVGLMFECNIVRVA
jgi:hypothetical protein